MTSLEAAGLWIGLHALLLIYISARVGQARVRNKVNLGDGGNDDMLKAIRTQGNYIEYAPAALLGLWVIASIGGGATIVHIIGGAFFFARVAHLLGLGMGVWSQGRMVGTVITMLTLFVTGAALVYLSVT